MRYLTDGQRKAMAGRPAEFRPPPRRTGDLWIGLLDRLVRLMTLGRGRVVRNQGKDGPIRWDGIMR